MGEQSVEPPKKKERLNLYFRNSNSILENPSKVKEFRSVLSVWDIFAPQTDEEMVQILENCPIITGAYNSKNDDLAVVLRPLLLDIKRPQEILQYKNIFDLTGNLTWSTHRNDIRPEDGSIIMVDLATREDYERMGGGKSIILHVLEKYQGFRKYTFSPSNARGFHEHYGGTFTGVTIKNGRPGYEDDPDVVIMEYSKDFDPQPFQPDDSF